MSRRRMIQAAVVALVLAASAPIAHAGGGGEGGIAGTFLFNCYAISGVNAPQEVDLTDQFGEQSGVKLGNGTLLCTPAGGQITSGMPNPGNFSDADHVKCYEVREGTNAKALKRVIDPFVTEEVTVGPERYVCVGAFKCDVEATDCGPIPE